MAYAPRPLRAWWDQQYPKAMPDELRVEWSAALAGMQIFTGRLIRRGARIIAGSDAPFVHLLPGFSLHDELQLLLACGMNPAQAIAAATDEAAEALGIDGLTGSIEAGKQADLLVLSGDPLGDIRALQRPVAVIRDGRWFSPDALLAQAADYAATATQGAGRRISDMY
jgi:imidazolonepropionase-like amidohydrolase